MIAASDFLSIHPEIAPKSKHFGVVAEGSFAAVLAQKDTGGAELVPDGGKVLPGDELPGGNDLPQFLPQSLAQFQTGQNPAPVNAQPEQPQPGQLQPETDIPETDLPRPDGIVPITESEEGIVLPAVQLPAVQLPVVQPAAVQSPVVQSSAPSTAPVSSEQEPKPDRAAPGGRGQARHNGKPKPSDAAASSRLAQAMGSEQPRTSERILSALQPTSPAPQMAGALPARQAASRSDAGPGNPGNKVIRATRPSGGPVRAEYVLEMKAVSTLAPPIAGGNGDAPSPQMQQLPSLALSVADAAPRPGTEAALRFGSDSGGQAQPQDFGSLVDRLAEAREAARSQTVRMAVAHADFGQISLRFRQDDGGLSVAMSSADPEFARAAQAAVSAERANAGQDNPQSSRQDDAMRQSAAGQSGAEGRQAGDRQDDHTGPQAQPGGEREADRAQTGETSAHDDNLQAGSSGDGRGGIFA